MPIYGAIVSEPLKSGDLLARARAPQTKTEAQRDRGIGAGNGNINRPVALDLQDPESDIRFTKEAKAALEIAIVMAKKHGGMPVCSEHILYGLLTVRESLSGRALRQTKVKPAGVELFLRSAAVAEPALEDMRGYLLGGDAWRILEGAREEAEYDRERLIDTDHLLLALIMDGSGKGDLILRQLNVNLFDLGAVLLSLAEEQRSKGRAPTPPEREPD